MISTWILVYRIFRNKTCSELTWSQWPSTLGVSVSPQVCAESVCVKHGLQQCDCPGDSMMEKCHTCCQQPGNHEPTEECVYTAGPRKSSCVNIYWGHPHVPLFCLYDITHNTRHPICCHGQVERTTSGVCFEALLHSLTDMWPNVIIWSANTIHPEPQNYFDFLSTVKSSTTELYSIVVSPFVLKQIECLLTFFFCPWQKSQIPVLAPRPPYCLVTSRKKSCHWLVVLHAMETKDTVINSINAACWMLTVQ